MYLAVMNHLGWGTMKEEQLMDHFESMIKEHEKFLETRQLGEEIVTIMQDLNRKMKMRQEILVGIIMMQALEDYLCIWSTDFSPSLFDKNGEQEELVSNIQALMEKLKKRQENLTGHVKISDKKEEFHKLWIPQIFIKELAADDWGSTKDAQHVKTLKRLTEKLKNCGKTLERNKEKVFNDVQLLIEKMKKREKTLRVIVMMQEVMQALEDYLFIWSRQTAASPTLFQNNSNQEEDVNDFHCIIEEMMECQETFTSWAHTKEKEHLRTLSHLIDKLKELVKTIGDNNEEKLMMNIQLLIEKMKKNKETLHVVVMKQEVMQVLEDYLIEWCRQTVVSPALFQNSNQEEDVNDLHCIIEEMMECQETFTSWAHTKEKEHLRTLSHLINKLKELVKTIGDNKEEELMISIQLLIEKMKKNQETLQVNCIPIDHQWFSKTSRVPELLDGFFLRLTTPLVYLSRCSAMFRLTPPLVYLSRCSAMSFERTIEDQLAEDLETMTKKEEKFVKTLGDFEEKELVNDFQHLVQLIKKRKKNIVLEQTVIQVLKVNQSILSRRHKLSPSLFMMMSKQEKLVNQAQHLIDDLKTCPEVLAGFEKKTPWFFRKICFSSALPEEITMEKYAWNTKEYLAWLVIKLKEVQKMLRHNKDEALVTYVQLLIENLKNHHLTLLGIGNLRVSRLSRICEVLSPLKPLKRSGSYGLLPPMMFPDCNEMTAKETCLKKHLPAWLGWVTAAISSRKKKCEEEFRKHSTQFHKPKEQYSKGPAGEAAAAA